MTFEKPVGILVAALQKTINKTLEIKQ